MNRQASPSRRGSARWAAGLVAIAFATAAAPSVALAAPGDIGSSQPAEIQALEGLRMTAVVLGLVAGIIPQPAVKSKSVAACPPIGILELERRVYAGEEGLPGLPTP